MPVSLPAPRSAEKEAIHRTSSYASLFSTRSSPRSNFLFSSSLCFSSLPFPPLPIASLPFPLFPFPCLLFPSLAFSLFLSPCLAFSLFLSRCFPSLFLFLPLQSSLFCSALLSTLLYSYLPLFIPSFVFLHLAFSQTHTREDSRNGISRKGYGAIAKKGARKGVNIDGMDGWVDMENQDIDDKKKKKTDDDDEDEEEEEEE